MSGTVPYTLVCTDHSDFSFVSVVQVGYHRAQQIDRQSALQTAEKENTITSTT